MTERDAFIRRICEEPDDDTARLVFADWLDENGEPGFAGYIRRHVADPVAATVLGPSDSMMAGAEVVASGIRSLRGKGVHPNGTVTLRRGFVAELECTTAMFLEHAKVTFSAHPVTRVVLTDRAMYPNSAGYSWYKANRDGRRTAPGAADVPDPIFEHLTDYIAGGKRYKSYQRNTAEPALSTACVAYGRALNDLPPLVAGR